MNCKLFGSLIDFFSNLGVYGKDFTNMSFSWIWPECTEESEPGGNIEIGVAICGRIRMNCLCFTYALPLV